MAKKETPRQRMINLMYLVFIAMLALNMSKEVLSAFGTVNATLEDSNESFESKNRAALEGLNSKAADSPEQYKAAAENAKQVSEATDKLYSYFSELKQEMYASVDDPSDYETMDKDQFLNEKFAQSGKLKPAGKEFKANMTDYKNTMVEVLGENPKYATYVKTIKEKFAPDHIVDRDGKEREYIEYHFLGYPLISSITKITNLQNGMKVLENEVLSTMLSGQLTEIASMDNYSTLLQTTRGAYYQGQEFDGSIVLGRTDNSTVPNEVNLTLDGRELTEGKDFVLEGGQIKMKVNAGNTGDHTIEGTLVFKQDGKDTEVEVNQSYSVIPKPNQAIVSADKMNVVYRGIENPLTISMPGVPGNKVNASAAGMRKVKGSQYVVKPTRGTELKINVTGSVEGEKVSSTSVFRIKDLPRPTPTIRGQLQEGGAVKMPRKALEVSPVGATFENFDFDLTPVVKRFTLSVPGQPAVVVNGNNLTAEAKKLLGRAKTGDIVQIFDIKADVPGVNVKNMPALLVQLTN